MSQSCRDLVQRGSCAVRRIQHGTTSAKFVAREGEFCTHLDSVAAVGVVQPVILIMLHVLPSEVSCTLKGVRGGRLP